MKTIFTLLLSTLFSVSLLAYEGTRLTISSISSNKTFVEVDGRRYSLGDQTLTLRDLRSGMHTIRIYSEIKKRTFRIFDIRLGKTRQQETIYNKRLLLKNGFHMDIVVNRFGKVFIDERRADRNDDWYNDDDDWDRHDRDPDGDRGWDNDRRNGRDYDDGHYSNIRVMSTADFGQARESLRREWFESNRLSNARNIISRNHFTTDMVKELLYLFTFENNRLELAKYAFGHTVDKGNYFQLKEVFYMKGNKDELDRYIRDYR